MVKLRALHGHLHRLPALLGTCVLGLLACAPGLAQGLFAHGPPPSFTAGQLAQGKAAYAINCVMCHGAHLDDGEFGPSLKGALFAMHWSSQSPGALFAYISATMPPSDPNSLSARDVTNIEAYLLQANGYRAGTRPLVFAGIPVPRRGGARSAPIPRSPFLFGPENYDKTYKAVAARRAAMLAALTPVTNRMLRHPPAGDWLMWRRTYASNGFSPLTQINRRNVATLRTAWSWALTVSPDEITPLVHDGVLFIKSANQVLAFNAATGTLLWRYVRRLPDADQNGRREIVKNLAIYGHELFAPTADGHMVALDVRTGKVIWDVPVLTPAQLAAHVVIDGGPMVVKGKVIQGVSGCTTWKGGCFIFALDAATGRPLWRFHTIARPGQPGGDSWNGAPLDQRYGSSVWTSGSYDPALNLLYYGTGQTYDTATLLLPHARQGASADAAYTDSTVALNPDTGKLVWYYQHFNRDVWDLDWVFEQTLLNLPIDGRPRKLLVTGGKLAIFDAIDRTDGQYLFSKDLGLQNLVASIDPRTGRKVLNPALRPQANVTKLLCPHGGGARSWPATSYDAATHILYIPLEESCSHFTWEPRDSAENAQGGNDMHWQLIPRPDSDGRFGRLEALNLATRKVLWIRRQRAPESSSVLATAGGLVFDGSRDREFRASDARTGKVLWQVRLDAVPSSTPVSYSVDGTQYIAVVVGGGGAHDATWVSLTPDISDPAGGTTLWVFRLPPRANPAPDRSRMFAHP